MSEQTNSIKSLEFCKIAVSNIDSLKTTFTKIVGMTTYELRLATDCPHNNGVFRTMIFF